MSKPYVFIIEVYDFVKKRWQPWPDSDVSFTVAAAKRALAWTQHEHHLTGAKFRRARYQRVDVS